MSTTVLTKEDEELYEIEFTNLEAQIVRTLLANLPLKDGGILQGTLKKFIPHTIMVDIGDKDLIEDIEKECELRLKEAGKDPHA